MPREYSRDQDIREVVDEIVDDMDPVRFDGESERLGLTHGELMGLVVSAMMERLK